MRFLFILLAGWMIACSVKQGAVPNKPIVLKDGQPMPYGVLVPSRLSIFLWPELPDDELETLVSIVGANADEIDCHIENITLMTIISGTLAKLFTENRFDEKKSCLDFGVDVKDGHVSEWKEGDTADEKKFIKICQSNQHYRVKWQGKAVALKKEAARLSGEIVKGINVGDQENWKAIDVKSSKISFLRTSKGMRVEILFKGFNGVDYSTEPSATQGRIKITDLEDSKKNRAVQFTLRELNKNLIYNFPLKIHHYFKRR